MTTRATKPNSVAVVAELGENGIVSLRLAREGDDVADIFTDATKLFSAIKRWGKPVSVYNLSLGYQRGDEPAQYVPAGITAERGGKTYDVAISEAQISEFEPTHVYLTARWCKTGAGRSFLAARLTAFVKVDQPKASGGKTILRDTDAATKPKGPTILR